MTQSISNRSSPIFGDSLPGYGNKNGGLFSPWEYETAPDYFERQNALPLPLSPLPPSPNPYIPPPLSNWQIEHLPSSASRPKEEKDLLIEGLKDEEERGSLSEEAELHSFSADSPIVKAPPCKRRRTDPNTLSLFQACIYVKEHQRVTSEQLEELEKHCWKTSKKSKTPRFSWAPPLVQALFSFAKYHTRDYPIHLGGPRGILNFLKRVCDVPEGFIPLPSAKSRLQESRRKVLSVDEFDWEGALITNNREN